MLRRYLLRFVILIGAGILAGLGVTAGSITRYGERSELVHADAAIVLGAAAWGVRPSPVFRERINHAIDLYQGGYADKLLFTGGPDSRNEEAEAVVARRYAIERGVPEANILIETRSRSTEQNLAFAKQLAGEHQLHRFLVVSDPLHMRRAMQMAADLGMDAHPSPTRTSRYQGLLTRLGFLARETYFYLRYLSHRVSASRAP